MLSLPRGPLRGRETVPSRPRGRPRGQVTTILVVLLTNQPGINQYIDNKRWFTIKLLAYSTSCTFAR